MKIIKKYGPLITMFILAGCADTDRQEVVFVNSYHAGYKPSDEITIGIKESLSSGEYDLKVFYLDSKRKSEKSLKQITDSINEVVSGLNPDLLIVSDDYAVKYLAEPFLKDSRAPVVFCGVNWSADQYELPGDRVTGMLEVLPLKESLLFVKSHYPEASRIAILSENSLSEQNNTILLDSLYKNAGFEPVYLMADDFAKWKSAFISANMTEDVIYLPTNGSIKGWNDVEARKFVTENIKKPVFTCDDFMMDYCVFGFTKVPREQGTWAAVTAMQILAGKSPSEIPVSRNSQKIIWFNEVNAGKIDFSPDPLWIKEAHLIKPE